MGSAADAVHRSRLLPSIKTKREEQSDAAASRIQRGTHARTTARDQRRTDVRALRLPRASCAAFTRRAARTAETDGSQRALVHERIAGPGGTRNRRTSLTRSWP